MGYIPGQRWPFRGSGHSLHSPVVVTMQVGESKFCECGCRALRKDSSHGRGAPLLPFIRGSVLGDPCSPNSPASPTFIVGGGGRGLVLWAEFVPSPGLTGPRAPHPVPWLLHLEQRWGGPAGKGLRAMQACLGGDNGCRFVDWWKQAGEIKSFRDKRDQRQELGEQRSAAPTSHRSPGGRDRKAEVRGAGPGLRAPFHPEQEPRSELGTLGVWAPSPAGETRCEGARSPRINCVAQRHSSTCGMSPGETQAAFPSLMMAPELSPLSHIICC